MDSAGEVVLRRFNGIERYRIAEANIMAWKIENGVQLSLDVETERQALESLPDTAALGACPSAEIFIVVPKLTISTLIGATFTVPRGEDDGQFIGRLYYCEHEPLDENVVTILERRDNLFHVKWQGTTIDVNYYDGSKPRTIVEIDGWFVFKDLAEWLP